MERSDARLIEYIERATRNGSALLRTLGVRGKALERDDPERAGFLLTAVRAHPLYKGGRLAFDMLEIEDLMLDASSVALLSDRQLTQLLRAVAANVPSLIDAVSGFGSGAGDGATRPGSVGESAAHARIIAGTHTQPATTFLPRVSFGPENASVAGSASSGQDNGRNTAESEPPLLSSDYLYDYVVIGLLDMLGRHISE